MLRAVGRRTSQVRLLFELTQGYLVAYVLLDKTDPTDEDRAIKTAARRRVRRTSETGRGRSLYLYVDQDPTALRPRVRVMRDPVEVTTDKLDELAQADTSDADATAQGPLRKDDRRARLQDLPGRQLPSTRARRVLPLRNR